jgi:ABC-type glycerol-3-phosphate transport system substrate-binding protein
MAGKRLCLLLIVITLLSACGGGQKTTPTAPPLTPETPAQNEPTTTPAAEATRRPDVVTIVFASDSFASITSEALNPYRDLAREFQKTHPHIVVKPKLPYRRSGETMQDMAQEADCFSWLPDLDEPGDREAILNLDPFLDADLSFTTDDFYPSLLQPFIWQGQLWGLPSEAMPEVIKYNKDLFDAAGMDYPAVDWSTDDFWATAKALTQGEGEEKQYGFTGGILEYPWLMLVLERQGARLLDTSVDPPTMNFTDPTTVEAMRWYTDFSSKYGFKSALDLDASELQESVPAFYEEWSDFVNSGRVAMWPLLEGLDLVYDPDGLSVGLATMPAGADGVAGAYEYISGYFISAHTQAGQACWEWITFLTGQPEAIWRVPARRSVVQSEAFRQKIGAERAAVYEASVAGEDRALTFHQFADQPWLAVAWLWLTLAHNQVVTGEAIVEESLDAAQQTFDAYRACIIARNAAFDEQEQRVCVSETDPNLARLLGW